MTDRTKTLIQRFRVCPNADDIPQIIIGMQEEDLVFESLEYPNCFKKMRNMCAHEPAEFASQLEDEGNKNCTTIAFSSNISGNYTLQIYQFTAWMFFMYKKTTLREYIDFWRSFCLFMCPAIGEVEPKQKVRLSLREDTDIRRWAVWIEDIICSEYNTLRTYNYNDEYYNKIYNEDVKLYLRMVFANMQGVVVMLVTGQIDAFDMDNVEGYLRLYIRREGLNADSREVQES